MSLLLYNCQKDVNLLQPQREGQLAIMLDRSTIIARHNAAAYHNDTPSNQCFCSRDKIASLVW